MEIKYIELYYVSKIYYESAQLKIKQGQKYFKKKSRFVPHLDRKIYSFFLEAVPF